MAENGKSLKLDSLLIKNFRSLEDFKVEKLGRVNLIVGRNNSGKSSVLEALRIYGGNANRFLLETIAAEHDERVQFKESERLDAEIVMPFQDFFAERTFPTSDETAIQIGSLHDEEDLLQLKHVFLAEREQIATDAEGRSVRQIKREPVSKATASYATEELLEALMVWKGSSLQSIIVIEEPENRLRRFAHEPYVHIPISLVPTQFVSQDELADDWDRIVFTEYEALAHEALRIIAPDFLNLTFVRSDEARLRQKSVLQRSARVKLGSLSRPIPLNSLGDGMLRVLQLALKTFPAKGGFLLIDEFENGLHYSVQQRVWRLLFEIAQRLDIQIFATTHSWDCIESFAKVAKERQDIDGVLFRMGRSARSSERGKVISTLFDEDALYDITQRDVEVR